MIELQPNTTVIGRLRIRSKSSDPQAEQQCVARVLNAAELSPRGLPASATLVVRRMDDPLPGQLPVRRSALAPDQRWQKAATAELDRLLRGAARPGTGVVPPSTEAVLFRSRAEMLACLAVDYLQGTLRGRWWWRWIIKQETEADYGVFRAWTEGLEFAPAALEILSKRGYAVDFVGALPESTVAKFLSGILRVHGIGAPQNVFFSPPTSSRESAHNARTAETISDQKDLHLAKETTPAWLSWVPEASAAPGLSPPALELLVQSLTLVRNPALARTSAFQRQLGEWLNHGLKRYKSARSSVRVGDIDSSREPTLTAEMLAANSNESTSESIITAPAVSSKREADGAADSTLTTEKSDVTDAEVAEPSLKENSSSASTVSSKCPLPASGIQGSSISAKIERLQSIIPADEESDVVIETAFGGVFFLINVALRLELYSDFTAPLKPGLELNLWDFLALLGTSFTNHELESDALWEVLATLAGRSNQQSVAAKFNPPQLWRIPPEWLNVFPEACEIDPVLQAGRLVTTHPAGFVMEDVPHFVADDGHAASLARWIVWISDYIRARLIRACGREDAAEMLCRLPARVAVTLTHVEVRYQLAHHPIEIRIAGLDRDPGWVPAAGRYVSFHFD